MPDYAFAPDIRLEALQRGETVVISEHANAWNLRKIKSHIRAFTADHLGSFRAELANDGVLIVTCDEPCEGSHADGSYTAPPIPPRRRSRRLPDVREDLLALAIGEDMLVARGADGYDLHKLHNTLAKLSRSVSRRFCAHLFDNGNLVVERVS